jgi:hypothetical protein
MKDNLIETMSPVYWGDLVPDAPGDGFGIVYDIWRDLQVGPLSPSAARVTVPLLRSFIDLIEGHIHNTDVEGVLRALHLLAVGAVGMQMRLVSDFSQLIDGSGEGAAA